MTHSALYEAAISQLGYEGSNINNRVLRCFSKVIKLFSISLSKTKSLPQMFTPFVMNKTSWRVTFGEGTMTFRSL